MIKKIKENKFFSEKGSVTLFILIAIIFFLIVSLNIYSSNKNKIVAQSKEIEAIKENYNKDLENMDNIYDNLIKADLKTVFIKQSSINSPNKEYYNLADWTNENVIAKVTVYAENNPNAQLQVKVTSKKTGNTVTYNKNQVDNNEVIITENSTVLVTFGDKEQRFELTKFDKEIPVLSYESFFTNNSKYTSGTWTNKETYTKISVVEEISGIPEIYYSTDKQNWVKLNFVQSNGIYQELNKYCGKETWTLRDGRIENVYFMAKDRAGNQSNISDVYQIRYDLTAPSKPTIENKYNDIWVNQEVDINVKSIDTLSKVSKIEYSYDEINWKNDWKGKLQTNGNESSIQGTWNSNINGKIYVRATDNAGNISETAYTILKQDLIPPTVTITPNGKNYYIPDGGKTTIKARLEAVDNESGLKTLQYAWSTSNTVEPTNWTTFENGKEITKTDVTSGTYYLWTNVIDNAGNRASKTKVSNPFIVSSSDSEAFKITITPTPTTWTKDNVNVTITYGPGLTQGKKAGMGVNIAEAQKLASENTASQITVTTNNYYIYAEAIDSNGNKVTATKQITNIDKIAPTVELEKNGGTYIVAQNSSFVPITTKITAQDLGGSGLSNLQYQISSSSTIPADNDPNWKDFTNGATITENKNGGTWYLYTKVTDRAGNRATHIQKSNPYVVNYSVRYDANGGTGTMPTDSILYNTPYTTRENSFTREGHTFKGWNERPDGTGKDWTEWIGKPWTWTYNKSITLYAQWTSNQSTLTVNPGGNNYTQKYGTTKQVSAPEQYYTINFNSNGGSEVSQAKAIRPFAKWTLTGDGQISSETTNPTTYTFGNGTGTLTASYSNTANAIILPTSTKWGYTIEGWYKDSALTQLAGRAGEEYAPTSSGTLYAKWTINNYYLDFNTKVDGVEYIHGYNQRVYIGLKVGGVDKGYVDDYNTIHVFGTEWEIYGLRLDGININYTAKGKVGDYNTTLNGKTFIIVDLNNVNISVNNSNYGSVSKNNMLILKGNTFTTNGTTLTLQDGRTVTANVRNDVGQVTTFMGWTPSSGTVNEPTSILANFTRNTSSSTLTIKLNGGTMNNSTNDITFTKKYGEVMEISVPTPPKGYTVTFGGNGGESQPSQTSSKSFGGWSKTGAGTLEGNRFTFGAGDTVLFANYSNNSITLPSTTRTGYTFTGWYDSIVGGHKIGNAGDKYTPTSNIALYAQWTKTNYNIDLNMRVDGKEYYSGYNNRVLVGLRIDGSDKGYIQDYIGKHPYETKWEIYGLKVDGVTIPYNKKGTVGTTDSLIYVDLNTINIGVNDSNYGSVSNTNLVAVQGSTFTTNGEILTISDGRKVTASVKNATGYTTKFAGWTPTNGTINTAVSVTANFSRTSNIYTMTYNSNGGSGENVIDNVSFGTNYVTKDNSATRFTKVGYEFVGWNTKPDGTGYSWTEWIGKPWKWSYDYSVTLYAQWRIAQYTLTVNPNGGTWNGTTSNSTFRQNYGTIKSISNPIPPKGYTVTFNGNGGESPADKTSTKSFTNWSNSGAGNLSGTTYTFGAGNGTLTANYKNNSITLPSASRTGYTFNGWYDSANGGNKIGNAGATYTPTSTKTLYAHWTANQYTLTINPNGGTWNNIPYNITFTKSYGETMTIEDPEPPRGYTITFNGNGGNSPATINSTKSFTNWTGTGAGTLTESTYTFGAGDCTLTAYYADDNIILPSTTRPGYIFDGWYDSINGDNKIGNAGDTYTPTIHKTLYAQWIDSTLPAMGMLTASPTSWTNGNVTLTGRAQDLGSGISYYQFSTNANLTSSSSGWISIPNTKNEIVKTYTVTTNGTYYFYVKDASGNINKKSIVVSNIDKILPTVQVTPTQGKYGKHNYRNVEITVELTATDLGGSGLNGLQYAWSTSDTAEPTQGWTNFTNNTTTTISSSAGKWYLWTKVTDRAGNRATNVQKVGPFIVYGWQTPSLGEWYYYGEETGEKLKGWQYVYHNVGLQDKKYWYYLQPDKDGLMTLGWASIDGYWYWFSDVVTEEASGGEMMTGWQQIHGKWFYFKQADDGLNWPGPTGSMLTGWQFINGNWYYLRPQKEGDNPERKCSNRMERN